MSKRLIIPVLFVCLIYGCCGSKNPPAAIKIGDISVSAAEFENAFVNSPYGTEDTASSRKKFLDNFITRKLILKEAERMGLDKDPEFLKSVELFWQQSLIKLTLDRKIKEQSSNLKVDDREIKEYYNARRDTEFKGRELSSVYDTIKWAILNKKQKDALDSWLEASRKRSKISINYSLLKIEKEGP